MLPNLFVIGAAKAGTTALHHYLGQHPAVFMSPIKEPNYFAFPEGPPGFAGPAIAPRNTFDRDRLRRERYELSVLNRAEYERLFVHGRGRPVRGESSPAYLYVPGTAARIRKAVPDARIVALLRDPIDRAYSKFTQMRRDAMEPLADFAAAVAAEAQRKRDGWAPTWLYMDRGFYHRQLMPYFQLFDRRQIHILLYDDLRRDAVGSVRSVFEFLEIDPCVPVDTSERHNSSAIPGAPRSGLLYALMLRPYLLSARMQGFLPQRVARHLRPLARRFLLKRPTASLPPELSQELREALVLALRHDIEQLERLIDRDLSQWRHHSVPRETDSRRADMPQHQND
jgi:hypothetical protein